MTRGFPHLSFGHMRCVQQLIAVLQVMLLQDQSACEQIKQCTPSQIELAKSSRSCAVASNEAKEPRHCRILLLPKQLLALQQLSMLFPDKFQADHRAN